MYETGYIMQNRLCGKKKRDITLAMVVAVPVGIFTPYYGVGIRCMA